MKNSILRSLALGMAAACALQAFAAPSVGSSPALPAYGDKVGIEVRNADWPMYLPATRFVRAGNLITVDFEYASGAFPSPAFGRDPAMIGELPPGNYIVQATLSDINRTEPTQVLSSNIAVMPPDAWGIYTVPKEPAAFAGSDVVVRSAAYFDPSSMRASVSGNVIRVDFDYYGNAPVGSSMPAGATSFASIHVPGLAPGSYHVEGWGRDRATAGSVPEKFFNRDFTVGSAATVVEYYSEGLDHYFISAGVDEVSQLDSGAQPGWKRTGQSFKAWLRQSDAPPGAQPVCRFYARGPNSHFYTGDPSECQFLKSLEQKQRAEASTKGQSFMGWQYEAVAFWALLPQNGQCPGGTTPVYRSYNNRAQQNDSNHRFTSTSLMHMAMQGWVDEGTAFCSPS